MSSPGQPEPPGLPGEEPSGTGTSAGTGAARVAAGTGSERGAPDAGSGGSAAGAGGGAEAGPSPAEAESGWRRESDAFLRGSAPDIAELPRETRWKAWRYRILWTAFVAVLALAASTIVSLVPALHPSLKTREAKTDDEAQDRVQSEKPPFSANVRYQDVMDVWKQIDSFDIIYDAPFSASESSELKSLRLDASDWDRVMELITRHGARPAVAQVFEVRRNALGEMVDSTVGYGQPFFLDLTSDRDSPVHIVDLRAKEERCTESRAQAVLTIPADGASAIESIEFTLQKLGDTRAKIPFSPDHEDGGKPYFSQKVVSVGGSSEPVTFNVTGYSRTHSRCEWKILATYNTSDEKNRRSEIGDEGKALVTEGVPRRPRQQWVMDPHEGKVIECNSNPQGSPYCD
ncbi:hypothetical protein AB0L74_26580 [Streptomyces sp. NPDC052020]|uniref:hypothetical protein n=1 Tax=Streptomyces sp. NPDC052020 TaxID=3155677 RepID=UPI0034126F14